MSSCKFKNLSAAPFELKDYADAYKNLETYKKLEKTSFNFKDKNKYSLNFTKMPNFYTWQNQYKNVHLTYKSIKIREILNHTLKKRGYGLNLFLLQKYHNNFNLNAKFYSFYTPKFTKVFKRLKLRGSRGIKNLKHRKLKTKGHIALASKSNASKSKFYYDNHKNLNKNKVFRKMFKGKKANKLLLKQKTYFKLQGIRYAHQGFKSLTKAMSILSFSPHFFLKVWKTPLPKTYVIDNATQAFNRFKNNMHFWSGLQSLRLVVNGKGSSQLLANYVANGVRRNRKRVAFIMYLKRLIDWHFKSVKNLQIQGIRIETKGRFNAKSRCRKYILCVGRVAKGEKTSKVDYAFTKAVTVFGSLGVKVWICPN